MPLTDAQLFERMVPSLLASWAQFARASPGARLQPSMAWSRPSSGRARASASGTSVGSSSGSR